MRIEIYNFPAEKPEPVLRLALMYEEDGDVELVAVNEDGKPFQRLLAISATTGLTLRPILCEKFIRTYNIPVDEHHKWSVK